jgi:hypothetical protein
LPTVLPSAAAAVPGAGSTESSGSALRTAERNVTARIAGLLPEETVTTLLVLINQDTDDGQEPSPTEISKARRKWHTS